MIEECEWCGELFERVLGSEWQRCQNCRAAYIEWTLVRNNRRVCDWAVADVEGYSNSC